MIFIVSSINNDTSISRIQIQAGTKHISTVVCKLSGYIFGYFVSSIVLVVGRILESGYCIAICIVVACGVLKAIFYNILGQLSSNLILQEIRVGSQMILNLSKDCILHGNISGQVGTIDFELLAVNSEGEGGLVQVVEVVALLVDDVDGLYCVLADLPVSINVHVVLLVLDLLVAVGIQLIQTDVQSVAGTEVGTGSQNAVLIFIDGLIIESKGTLVIQIATSVDNIAVSKCSGSGAGSHHSSQNQSSDLLSLHCIFLHLMFFNSCFPMPESLCCNAIIPPGTLSTPF